MGTKCIHIFTPPTTLLNTGEISPSKHGSEHLYALLVSLKIEPPKPRTGDIVVVTASAIIDDDAKYKLSGTLDGTGLDIKPEKQIVFVSTSGDQQLVTASWAVQAKEPNRYPLIFTPFVDDAVRTLGPAKRHRCISGKT